VKSPLTQLLEKRTNLIPVLRGYGTAEFLSIACSATSINLFAQSGKRNGEYPLFLNAKERGPSRRGHNGMTTEWSRMFRGKAVSFK
jgi:hypothetical protein